MNYYSIPLRLDQIVRGTRKDEEVELRLAIHQNIRMILKAFSLSYRYDPTFGCVMNKYHASTPPQKQSERIWRESMRESIQENLKDMLQRYETRVRVQDLIIDMRPQKKSSHNAVMLVKVQISGQLTLGRKENFKYPDSEVSDDAKEVFPLMIPVGKGK